MLSESQIAISEQCYLCPLMGKCLGQVINREGNGKVLLVGEAPGLVEVSQGRPFVGKSGQLLRQLLEEVGLTDVSITNAVRCLPDSETPTPPLAAVVACRGNLLKDIDEVSPKVIVCLGNIAAQSINNSAKVRAESYQGIPVIYTVHPAYVLRRPSERETLKSALLKAKQLAENTSFISANKLGVDYEVITTPEELHKFVANAKTVVIDVEVGDPSLSKLPDTLSGKMFDRQRIISMAFAREDGKVAVIPLLDAINSHIQQFKDVIRDLCSNERIEKVAHNVKFDWMWLSHTYGFIPMRNVMDTMLLAYALREDKPSYALKTLLNEIFGIPHYDSEIQEYTKGNNYACIPPKLLYRYNALDAYWTMKLCEHLKQRMDDNARKLMKMVLIPASFMFGYAEIHGIYVQQDVLDRLLSELDAELRKIEETIRQQIGQPINLLSHQQLSVLLFQSWGLKPVKLTASGQPSVDAEALSLLAQQYPQMEMLQLIAKYKQLYKIKRTYLERLKDFIHADGRIRPDFVLTAMVSGRIAVHNPALQTFPSKSTEIGKKLHEIFSPPEGRQLLSFDFSQHEIRVLGCLAKEPRIRKAFLNGEDFHRSVAAQIFRKPIEEVTDLERKLAKGCVFGALYGITPTGFARQAGISEDEAAKLLNAFLKQFPKVLKWQKETIAKAKEAGVLFTPTGRRRHLEDIRSSDNKVRSHATREAINFPVQSFASDLALLTAIEYTRRLGREAPVVMFIHDAIWIDAPASLADEIAKALQEVIREIEQRFDLYVPLEISS